MPRNDAQGGSGHGPPSYRLRMVAGPRSCCRPQDGPDVHQCGRPHRPRRRSRSRAPHPAVPIGCWRHIRGCTRSMRARYGHRQPSLDPAARHAPPGRFLLAFSFCAIRVTRSCALRPIAPSVATTKGTRSRCRGRRTRPDTSCASWPRARAAWPCCACRSRHRRVTPRARPRSLWP